MSATTNLTAIELLDKTRSRALSVREVVEQVAARMEETKRLNAFISADKALALSRAKSLDAQLSETGALPLHGMPVVVKDNMDVKGYATTGGTPALLDNKPEANAGVVEKLINAGAVVVGKTNLHELAYGITNNNAHFGPARNPYDPALIPGGSSGGSAVAVAARVSPVGLGTDTGGSARIPAALCGVCGFRPTTGRYPGGGVINISHTRDTAGVFARSVADIQLIDAALTRVNGPDAAALEELRIGAPADPFYLGLEDPAQEIIQAALARLEDNKATLAREDLKGLLELNEKVGFPIVLHETIPGLRNYLVSHGLPLDVETLVANIASPDVKGIIEPLLGAGAVPEAIYQEAKNTHRPKLRQLYRDYFAKHNIDAMVYPTTPLTARPIGQDMVELGGRETPTFLAYIRNSDPSANAAIPSLSIPAGLTADGLPVGISIDGPEGTDRKVLAIGAAFQAVLPQIEAPAV